MEASVQLETAINELEETKTERDEIKSELNKLKISTQGLEMEYAELEGQLTKDNSDLNGGYHTFCEILLEFWWNYVKNIIISRNCFIFLC